MNIKKVKTYIIKAPIESPFYFSQGFVYDRCSVIVEVVCDDDESGFGECLCHGMQPPQISAAFVENFIAPRVVGRDIYDVEVLWEELYNLSRPFGQQGIAVNALSGFDIALWDAIGKHLGKPVSKLIGGTFRTSLKAYATGFHRREGKKYPEDAIAEAHRHIENGFKAMKLKAGFGVEKDIAYIRAIREAIGFDVMLMADFNSAYSQAEARRILYSLEPERLEFFEELLAPEDIAGYTAIRNLTASYVTAGEQTFGKMAFKEWLSRGALDIYQPDLCSSGGFTECKKIAALCQAYNTMLIPHVWGSGIGLAASLQFLATLPATPLRHIPTEPLLEFDQASHPFKMDLIYGAIKLEDGYVKVPDAPGIGVEVNREIIQKFCVNH